MENKSKKPKRFYILGFIVTVLISPFFGLLSIYYSSLVTPKFKFGDYTGALKASRNAKFYTVYVIFIALVFSVISSLISGEAFEAMNNGYCAAHN